jgi:hypothetical protein
MALLTIRAKQCQRRLSKLKPLFLVYFLPRTMSVLNLDISNCDFIYFTDENVCSNIFLIMEYNITILLFVATA